MSSHRRVGIVAAGNHVEIEAGLVVWIDPRIAAPGTEVCVLRCPDGFAVWTTDPDPRPLVLS